MCSVPIHRLLSMFSRGPTKTARWPAERRSVGTASKDAPASLGGCRGVGDPPPLKWSDLRYVFDIQEDCNGKEAIQEIVAKLRQGDVLVSQGQNMVDAIRQIG